MEINVDERLKTVGVKRIKGGGLCLYGEGSSCSLENYLLEFEVTWYQKVRAWMGREVFIGDFKPENPGYDFDHYYLGWCLTHQKYFVTYKRGSEPRLECPDCHADFMLKITEKIKNKNERKLKLVKSDKGLKS